MQWRIEQGMKVIWMRTISDSDTVLLMTLLQDPRARGARQLVENIYEVQGCTDRTVADVLERQITAALASGESSVELSMPLAALALSIVKAGCVRKRGGQLLSNAHAARERTLLRMAEEKKQSCRRVRPRRSPLRGVLPAGMSATDAHAEGAEYAVNAVQETLSGRSSKWHISVETLARKMQKRRR
jgi:hypothetical protein